MMPNTKIAGGTFAVLSVYKEEVLEEWKDILDYWIKNTIDETYGGFYGSVNNDNTHNPSAPKGIVMNSRILWAFSASFSRLKNKRYLNVAERAFNYITDNFIDLEFGGVFWAVDNKGILPDGKKQIYGLAFCIYGMSEYFKATKNEYALDLCKELFYCIEKFSLDKKNGGYLEAFSRDWKLIDDLRLSDKDCNEKKTMNTHLHVIEAYANLYTVWPDKKLADAIEGLLNAFTDHIINKNNFHLNLFLDEEWNPRSSLISFGHDIEAAWLLQECAEILGKENYISQYKKLAVELTNTAIKGLDGDGGLFYEYEPKNDVWIKEKHSWPQAEAMIGFMNAYQLTGDEKYLHHSINSWSFIKKNIMDKNNGEWFWGIDENNKVMQKDKAGFWKCPYHNTRACMEIDNRITNILK